VASSTCVVFRGSPGDVRPIGDKHSSPVQRYGDQDSTRARSFIGGGGSLMAATNPETWTFAVTRSKTTYHPNTLQHRSHILDLGSSLAWPRRVEVLTIGSTKQKRATHASIIIRSDDARYDAATSSLSVRSILEWLGRGKDALVRDQSRHLTRTPRKSIRRIQLAAH